MIKRFIIHPPSPPHLFLANNYCLVEVMSRYCYSVDRKDKEPKRCHNRKKKKKPRREKRRTWRSCWHSVRQNNLVKRWEQINRRRWYTAHCRMRGHRQKKGQVRSQSGRRPQGHQASIDKIVSTQYRKPKMLQQLCHPDRVGAMIWLWGGERETIWRMALGR